jgi:FkbM family methyltransferase
MLVLGAGTKVVPNQIRVEIHHKEGTMFNDKEFIIEMVRDQIYNRRYDMFEGIRPSKYETAMELFWDMCMEKGLLQFGKVKLPDIRWFYGWREWPIIYGDSIMIHHLMNDEYTRKNADRIEDVGGEGPYFVDDIIVKSGETLIDAGAYIGDFAAAAAALGAKVYAFEPSPKVMPILRDAGMLNGFEVIGAALAEVKLSNAKLDLSFPGGDFISNSETLHYEGDQIEGRVAVETTTLDDFSRENNIHIDFLKADIEGFERFMLKGAKNVLQQQEPKLAIRTYHNNHEDMKVIPELIKKINPRYNLKYSLRETTVYASTERGL